MVVTRVHEGEIPAGEHRRHAGMQVTYQDRPFALLLSFLNADLMLSFSKTKLCCSWERELLGLASVRAEELVAAVTKVRLQIIWIQLILILSGGRDSIVVYKS